MTDRALTLSQRAKSIVKDPFFWLGAKEMSGTALGIAAWGLVTGVAMVKSGLSVPLALLMGFTAYARQRPTGRSAPDCRGRAAVGGLVHGNLREPALCDFVEHVAKLFLAPEPAPSFDGGLLQRRRDFCELHAPLPRCQTAARAIALLLGRRSDQLGGLADSIDAGYFLADQIPLSWGLGFAGVLALLGVLLSMLNDRATWVASVVACTAAVAFALPLKLNILVAIAAAVAAGLMTEQLQNRPAN